MRIDIWPDSTPKPNQPYLNRHSNLSLYLAGYLYRGTRFLAFTKAPALTRRWVDSLGAVGAADVHALPI